MEEDLRSPSTVVESSMGKAEGRLTNLELAEQLADWIAGQSQRGDWRVRSGGQATRNRALRAFAICRERALEDAVKIAEDWGETIPVSGPQAKGIAVVSSSAGKAIAKAIRKLKE